MKSVTVKPPTAKLVLRRPIGLYKSSECIISINDMMQQKKDNHINLGFSKYTGVQPPQNSRDTTLPIFNKYYNLHFSFSFNTQIRGGLTIFNLINILYLRCYTVLSVLGLYDDVRLEYSLREHIVERKHIRSDRICQQ